MAIGHKLNSIVRILTTIILGCGLVGPLNGVEPASIPEKNIISEEIDLDRRIPAFEFNAEDLLHAIRRLAYVGVPVGLIIEKDPAPFSLRLRDAQVKDVLDALVAEAPGYEWVASSGIIHIQPKKLKGTVLYTTLQQPISGFSSEEYDGGTAIHLLGLYAEKSGLPIAVGGISTSTLQIAADQIPEDARLFIKVDQPTKLVEVLDSIILKDAPGFWMAKPIPDGRITLFGGAVKRHSKPSRNDNKALPPGQYPHDWK
jgi:hypothetical protein